MHYTATTYKGLKMIHEKHDSKTEAQAYLEDMKQQREEARIALAEQVRIDWAQHHGNDSGFDRYAHYE
jgi:sulfur relay (sulfurtransferase) DsrC/TusE family protein